MTLQQAFDNFIQSKQLAGLSVNTITDYKAILLPLIRPLGLSLDIGHLTPDMVISCLTEVMKRSISRTTKATYVRNLKILFCWIEDNCGVSLHAHTIRVPKSSKKQVRIYTDEEIRLMFLSVETSTDWITARNKCILACMYDSGIRQAEVCTLQWANVSFDTGTMVVHGKGDKERTVPLGQVTKRFMQEYRDKCPYKLSAVFVSVDGRELTCNTVKQFVSKLSARLPFQFSSHKLRHNFATNYCLDQYEHNNGNIDIYKLMYLMGHEDIATTRRYLHFAMERIASKGCISHLDGILHL